MAIQGIVAAIPLVVVDTAGGHWLKGSQCNACRTVVAGERLACPACGHRKDRAVVRLAQCGTINTWTEVHRSFPNVVTPFTAVVVDLDDGCCLKGTLLGVEPGSYDLAGQRVRIVFRDTGQRDTDDRAFLSYFFEFDGAASR